MFHRSMASNSEVNSPIWSELVQDFMSVLCKYDEDPNKSKVDASEQHFPHYKSWELSVWVLIQSVQKAYAAFSPIAVMLHIKFDQDWATCCRELQVWKCERTADYRYTVSSTCEPSAQVS